MSNISKIRNELHLTQRQLAEAAGVSSRTLARWEAEAATPRPKHLLALARALDCTVETIEPVTDLTTARRAAGLTQRDFAARANIPLGSLTAIETGRVLLPDASLWALILGRTTAEINELASQAIDRRYQLLKRA